jgi:hypothetical protein
VGPIREAQLLATESLPECEAGCDINGLADMVDFVRQWAQVGAANDMCPWLDEMLTLMDANC